MPCLYAEHDSSLSSYFFAIPKRFIVDDIETESLTTKITHILFLRSNRLTMTR
jgi:hypothetical protein